MERVESELFKANKKRLKQEQRGCFICGATEDLEVHHLVCAYAKQQEVDYEQLKAACLSFDIYGYSEKMVTEPITSVDDIRNLILLCEGHHKRMDHGIHNVTFGDWIMQRVRGKANENRKDS